MPDDIDALKRRSAAVVLAAGLSRRFPGRNKLLADLAGRSLLSRTLQRVAGVRLGEVVVVSGRDEAEVRQLAEAARFRTARNFEYEQGVGASIATGIRALGPSTEAAFIILGDMPFVAEATFEPMLRALFAADGGPARHAAVPAYQGKRGNPVLFGAGLFPELARLTGDFGARPLCAAEPGREILVEVDDPGIHWDVDTPADLVDANAQWKPQRGV
jgi:molybdenum cofactor cytidylyltransferase